MITALRGSPVNCILMPGKEQERIRGIRSGKKGLGHRAQESGYRFNLCCKDVYKRQFPTRASKDMQTVDTGVYKTEPILFSVDAARYRNASGRK